MSINIYCLMKNYIPKFSRQHLFSRMWFHNSRFLFQNDYVNKMFSLWKQNPSNVHEFWNSYFHKSGPEQLSLRASQMSIQPSIAPKVSATKPSTTMGKYATTQEHLTVYRIINAYQNRGHLISNLDPLNINRGPNVHKYKDGSDPILRSVKVPSNMDTVYKLPKSTFIGGNETELPLKSIMERLNKTYCQTIGLELHHITDLEQELFIKERFESPKEVQPLSTKEKILLLTRLCYAHHFEFFLSKKYPAEKRFGLEGCDSYIPGLRHLIEVASNYGAEFIVMGMAHRGRLNTLANVMEVSLTKLFTHFQPLNPTVIYGQGDVKYHVGATTTIKHAVTGKPIITALCSNASHLEAVNPIASGKTAAEQKFTYNKDKMKVWPITIHGDAAVSGQGVVYETFHQAELECYAVGGTIHVVINNQIGFTTDPYRSRSSEYCTAVAKVVDAPIFHVNADDIEAVHRVCTVATEYRAKFHNDVVIDIIGYRRYGHNEVDEPMFTQPIMYQIIKDMKPAYFKYREKLLAEKVVSETDVKAIEDDYMNKLEVAFQEAMTITKLDPSDWLSSSWKKYKFFSKDKDIKSMPATGITEEVLMKIGHSVSTPPSNFSLHRGVQRMLSGRKQMLEKKIADWALGESFAFGSILQEGLHVRLSGEDVERGTFSHRHHVMHDQENGKKINVLENLFPNQGKYALCNSALSEFATLGYDFGVALVNPMALVIWEAQFGDFANTAQVIFDQFMSSGEEKWYRQAGLTCFLPHGMEGQGPEHSSARPERYLQQCNDDDQELVTNMADQLCNCNWIIVYPSIPANMFHVLRRQVKLNFRKPLIILTPKSLLRLPDCISPLSDFIGSTQFRPYLPDPDVKPSQKVTKLLLCSGKVYYELKEIRKTRKLVNQIAIGRIEQLSPLPYTNIYEDAIEKFPSARVFWVQEEHKNQGFWTYVSPRLNKLLGRKKGQVTYIGRGPSASPATGHKKEHSKEREQFLVAAMTL